MQPNQHHQQLQPFGCSGGGSNSAHSSPLKRAPQAVSPLASPMESRRVFMAHQRQSSGGGDGSPQHQQPAALGLSAVQLGYAMPACRLLVDPQTGQQFFVPTGPAPHPAAVLPAPSAYFQPAATTFFYNQPAAHPAFFPTAHAQSHQQPANTAPANQGGPGGYLFAPAGHQYHQPIVTSSTGGYYAPHQPISTQPSAASNYYAAQHQRAQSPIREQCAYRVEVPPSTVGSVYGGEQPDERERDCSGGYAPQNQFQRREQCRLSTESRGSSIRSGGGGAGMVQHQLETNSNPEDSYGYARSPPPPAQHHHQQYQQLKPIPPPLQLHQNNQQQMQMSTGNGNGGSSSESTSGFASAGRGRARTFGDEPQGRVRSPPQSPLKEQRGLAAFPPLREERRSPPPPPPNRMKAIRMDIDLSRPMSPPENASTTRPMMSAFEKQQQRLSAGSENQSVSVRATVSRAAPPTAFTISFNNDAEHEQVSISELSLQEAARQAPKGRRLMLARRSVPPRGPQSGHDSGSECGDPKRWLFRKMLQGGEGRPASGDGSHREEDEHADHEDLASEAGTYVVDRRLPSEVMTNSQISGTQTQRDGCSDADSSSSSSSTSSSRTPSPGPQPPIRPSLVGAAASGKRSLMTDLRRLQESKQQSTNPSFTSSAAQQKKPTTPSATIPKQPPPPTISTQRKQQPTTTAVISTSVGTAGGVPNRPCRVTAGQQAFRPHSTRCRSEPRNDGGRFSMRPTGSQHRPLPALQVYAGRGGPLPMRQQSANAAAVAKVQQQKPVQKSPEMLNWLRRKEYDPRKSTTAISTGQPQKSQQQLKAQSHNKEAPLAYAESTTSAECEESFMANRSLSAVPSNSGGGAQKQSPFARWRTAQQAQQNQQQLGMERPGSNCNRSHDDLSRLGESLDEESLMGGPDSCTSSLQRTVDELTQKCHKSITLLKLCNQQSALSPSVEQLQQKVISASAGGISDQLEGLSSAFDAIQKYLEEQTVFGGNNSAERTMSGTFTKRRASNGNSHMTMTKSNESEDIGNEERENK